MSLKHGPCYSLLNGLFVADGAPHAYIDNVCVEESARRRGAATALLHGASRVAEAAFGSAAVYTHAHVANGPARSLYDRFGFVAPPLASSRQDAFDRASDRMRSLLLLVAPVPLSKARASGVGLQGWAGASGGLAAACGTRSWPRSLRAEAPPHAPRRRRGQRSAAGMRALRAKARCVAAEAPSLRFRASAARGGKKLCAATTRLLQPPVCGGVARRVQRGRVPAHVMNAECRSIRIKT